MGQIDVVYIYIHINIKMLGQLCGLNLGYFLQIGVEAHKHSSHNSLSSIPAQYRQYHAQSLAILTQTPLFSNLLLEQVLVGVLWNLSVIIFGFKIFG